MPMWKPSTIWSNLDAFVLGGGSSLRGFDWSLLVGERVVGCNQAFRLGAAVCKFVVFCDRKVMYERDKRPRAGFYGAMAKYAETGTLVTTDPMLRTAREQWLKWMPRKSSGLHRDALGFNCNTGMSALNLALLLGATTVYLLGFDMHLDGAGRPNWHDNVIDNPNAAVYGRMIRYCGQVARDLPRVFPGCQVYNVTDDSALDAFPKVAVDTFWKDRRRESDSIDAKTEGRVLAIGV